LLEAGGARELAALQEQLAACRQQARAADDAARAAFAREAEAARSLRAQVSDSPLSPSIVLPLLARHGAHVNARTRARAHVRTHTPIPALAFPAEAPIPPQRVGVHLAPLPHILTRRAAMQLSAALADKDGHEAASVAARRELGAVRDALAAARAERDEARAAGARAAEELGLAVAALEEDGRVREVGPGGLGWVWLGWVGLGWDGLGWVGLGVPGGATGTHID
jgi:hypothetical protein